MKNFPIIKPELGEEEAAAAREAILSGWVTQGPQVAAFEEDFRQYVGAEYATAVSNCTAALHLALKAVGVGPGDEVITVSHSFIATVNAIRYLDAVPVMVDIEADTYNISPGEIINAIGPKTKAILVVHQIGMPCEIHKIVKIARDNDIPIIEDAACAIGSELQIKEHWERIGKPHGDIACFSLHPRKLLTTGDGGMITTNQSNYNDLFKRWRQHSMSATDLARHQSKNIVIESYADVGYNYRLTDIQAAIGRVQLKKLPGIIERRIELASVYNQLIDPIAKISAPYQPSWAKSNYQSYCALLDDSVDQEKCMQFLKDQGITTKPGVMCAHLQPAYRDEPHRLIGDLKNSRKVFEKGLMLPLYSGLTSNDQEFICEQVKKAVESAS